MAIFISLKSNIPFRFQAIQVYSEIEKRTRFYPTATDATEMYKAIDEQKGRIEAINAPVTPYEGHSPYIYSICRTAFAAKSHACGLKTSPPSI